MKNVIIFGPPGAGKGTQAVLIAEKHNLAHLSSGELFRDILQTESELGDKIKSYYNQGVLVPDELTTELIRKGVKDNLDKGGFIFDGYPRSVEQAEILSNILSDSNLKLDAVLNLEINEEEAIQRILLRAKTSGRSDDNEETIRNRFQVYKDQTEPLLKHYEDKGKLININGERAIEEIAKDMDLEIKKL